MSSSNTPSLCHLITENHNQEEHSAQHRYFFLPSYKEVKKEFYVYIHIIFDKKNY